MSGGQYPDDNSAKANGIPSGTPPARGFTISGSETCSTTMEPSAAWAEFVIGPNNVDGSGNTANGTRFSFPVSGGTFE